MNTTVSKYEKHLSIIYRKRTPELIIASAVVVIGVVVSYMLLVRDQNILLYYGDSISHLLISRRLVDSIIPGLAQLGGVWLPMTHIFLSPFVINDFLFHTGFAGTIVSIVCTAVTAVACFRIVKFQFNSVPAGLLASSIFFMNPSVIYMGIVPMMEAPFMMFFMLSVYYVQKWYYIYKAGEGTWNQYRTVLKCGLVVSAASLTRYEGWILPFGLIVILAIIQLIIVRRKEWRYRFEAILLVAIIFGSMGIMMWVLWNTVIFKDPLYFATGPYSAQVQSNSRTFSENTKLNPINSSSIIFDVAIAMYGMPVLVISILGIVTYLYMGRKEKTLSFSLLTIIMLMLPTLVDFIFMVQGSGEIYPVREGWFNGRYLIFLAPLFAFGSVSLVIFISRKKKKMLIIMPIVIIIIASYIFTILDQPIERGKVVALKDPVVSPGESQHVANETGKILQDQYVAVETGKILKTAYEGGHIVLFAQLSHIDRIIFFSNLPLKTFIDVTSGHYWQTSEEKPWVYGKYVILEKPTDVFTMRSYDPLRDIVGYWHANESTLMEHYKVIYENQYFKILEKTEKTEKPTN
jgi:hypothetical protein